MKRVSLIVLPMLLMTSCMSFSDRPMRPVRNALLEQMPQITLEKEVAINLGGGLFNVLDAVTFNDANLSEIDNVEVVVYSPKGDLEAVDFNGLSFKEALLDKNADLQWERIVRVRDEGEQVWVFAGMNIKKNALEAISVFVIEANEIVLVNVNGDMNKMMEYALAQSHDRRKHDSHKDDHHI